MAGELGAQPGRKVGKYTLVREIGSGGMGTVFEATHRNGHRVALKMLKAPLGVTAEVRERFLREGHAANRVHHPGAVRILDDDATEDGRVFLVMELLEGQTLAEMAVARGGALPVKTVLLVGRQLLDVLAAAHDAGIVHRDIKPENIFVQATGKVKVVDFGIARIVEGRGVASTATGRMLGTPAFMPPEQAYGRRSQIDARSDVWAVGATLFTALAGRVVHVAPTAEETLILAATENAPPLASVFPDAPPAVAAIVDRALRSDKDERWPSAREMRAALDVAYVELFGAPVPDIVAREDEPTSAPSVAGASVASNARDIGPVPAAPSGVLGGAKHLLLATAVALVLVGVTLALRPLGLGLSRPHRRAMEARTEAAEAVPVVLAPAPAASEDRVPSLPSPTAAPEPVSSTPPAASSGTLPAARPVAIRIASPVTAPVRPSPRAGGSASPMVSAAVAPSRAPSAVCGFDLDEDGRKWPRRCP